MAEPGHLMICIRFARWFDFSCCVNVVFKELLLGNKIKDLPMADTSGYTCGHQNDLGGPAAAEVCQELLMLAGLRGSFRGARGLRV